MTDAIALPEHDRRKAVRASLGRDIYPLNAAEISLDRLAVRIAVLQTHNDAAADISFAFGVSSQGHRLKKNISELGDALRRRRGPKEPNCNLAIHMRTV